MRKELNRLLSNEGNALLSNKKLSFAATEAYKLLRTNLLFTLPDENKCRIVGVTSSIRGEGKSTTAVNLSYTLAETGKRVLLMDGDLRLPSVAKKLDISGTPGISNIIAGDASVVDAVKKTEQSDGWYVLPAGDIPPNPTEMLGSSQMKKLIDESAQSYDFIIIDLPPVNLVSDALVISSCIDGMLVVVRENYSERRELKACMKQLELSGTRVLGVVMNATNRAQNNYGHYYRKKNSNIYLNKYYKDSKYYKKAVNTVDESGIKLE